MRRSLKTIFALLIALLLTVSLVPPEVSFAQEVPAVVAEEVVPVTTTPATTGEVAPVATEVAAPAEATPIPPEPVWFGNVQLWEILASLVALIWAIIKTKMKLDSDWEKKVLSFFEAGVQLTYDEMVREAKKANEGGKLSKVEVDAARGRAWEAAKQYAADQGVDLGKQILAEQVPVWITKVWNSFKKDKDSK